jgi:hypothetical protein
MRWLIIALLTLPFAHALEWSEIHFNPTGNDNGKEFIELIGTEDLEGCTVEDSASSDKIILVKREDTHVILIVEVDGIYNDTPNATVYHVGLAIGNGLGNTAERITISCTGSALISTAYNISGIDGYKEGLSIIYRDGWTVGLENGTPGMVDSQDREEDSHEDYRPESNTRCNDTLLLTLQTTSSKPGERVTFDIVSADYAWYEAIANGTVIGYGDTLEEEHSIILPDVSVKLTAYARHCGGRQRMTRTIAVIQEPEVAIPAPPLATQQTTAPAPAPTPTATVMAETPQPTVLVDQDRDAVPWISAFGIVTVITSAAVFLLRREE